MCVCATFPFLTTGIACIHPTDKNKANLAKPKDIHITSSFLSIPSPESGGKQKPRRTVADSSHFNG